jgi:hypothetical protein
MARYYLLLDDEDLDFILDFEGNDVPTLTELVEFIAEVQEILEEAPVVPEDEL